VSDLLSYNNIITDTPSFNECLLRRVNVVRQMRFESICNALRNDFVNDIAKTNRPEISWHKRRQLFQNKNDMSIAGLRGQRSQNEKNPSPAFHRDHDHRYAMAQRDTLLVVMDLQCS
jgi:hypothetical protein